MTLLSHGLRTCAGLMIAASLSAAEPLTTPAGWTAGAPRDEIKPQFIYKADGGADGRGTLIIRTDHREGLDGFWTKTFPVVGGSHYRFEAFYRAVRVAVPRRSAAARLRWQNAAGHQVPSDEPVVRGYLVSKSKPLAADEFPTTRAAGSDGWTEVSATYLVPREATQAKVELHLQWAADAEVQWNKVSMSAAAAPRRGSCVWRRFTSCPAAARLRRTISACARR